MPRTLKWTIASALTQMSSCRSPSMIFSRPHKRSELLTPLNEAMSFVDAVICASKGAQINGKCKEGDR